MNWRGNLLKFCDVTGMPVLEPFVRLAAGEDVKEQMVGIAKFVMLPVMAVIVFIGLWSGAAKTIVSDSARLPSPTETEMHEKRKSQGFFQVPLSGSFSPASSSSRSLAASSAPTADLPVNVTSILCWDELYQYRLVHDGCAYKTGNSKES